MPAWLVWMIVAAVLSVVELLTFTVAAGLLAVAAVAAAVTAALGAGAAGQAAAFAAAGGVSMAAVLPAARRHRRHRRAARPAARTGVAALVGQSALVIEPVDAQHGRVRINGEVWSARAFTPGQVIPAGAVVDVFEIDGATAVVYPREAAMIALIIVAADIDPVALAALARTIRIVPQARAYVIERLGSYNRTLSGGFNTMVPMVDRVRSRIDLREQVVSFAPQPVITEDNLVVHIDTVLYFQVDRPAGGDLLRSPITSSASNS